MTFGLSNDFGNGLRGGVDELGEEYRLAEGRPISEPRRHQRRGEPAETFEAGLFLCRFAGGQSSADQRMGKAREAVEHMRDVRRGKLQLRQAFLDNLLRR